MANTQSAKKRIRTNERRRIRNKVYISKAKTLMKSVLESNDPETADARLKETISFLDKTASKGRLHKNNVARKKSKLHRHVNNLEKK